MLECGKITNGNMEIFIVISDVIEEEHVSMMMYNRIRF